LGRCSDARRDSNAAREKYKQVIKIGQSLNTFYLVYLGLVNIARTYLVEGKKEKALEISLIIKDCQVEHNRVREEGLQLLTDLQATLPEWQVKSLRTQAKGELTADQAAARALAYVQENTREYATESI
jgi:hypothetical protein